MPTDHGFSPGVTQYDLQYLNLLKNRQTATLDTDAYPPPAKLKTVADLWKHLSSTAAKPIGDIVLVSHGNETGDMALKLVAKGRARTDYDELLRIQGVPADTAAAKLPDELRQSSPGMPPQARTIHIRGCQIGRDTKYMNRLRDVLGGDKVSVTAPRHLAGLRALIEGKRVVADPPSHGYLECLEYEFVVQAKNPFADRASLVKAFKDAKHKFIDNTQVPDELWDQWVPGKTFDATTSPITMPPLDLGATLQSTNPAKKLPKLTTMWSDGKFEHYKIPITVSIAAATKPKPEDHRALILTELRKSDLFSRADHPFQEQMGFATLEAYVDGQSWTPSYDPKKKILAVAGVRHYYAAQIPLCDPSVGDKKDPKTWRLIYNFYGLRGGPVASVEKMSTSDARLFFTTTKP